MRGDSMRLNTNSIVGNILRGRSIKTSVLRGLASSGLSGIWRSLAVGMLGGMTVADVYLTNHGTGERIALSWVPEKISVKEAAQFQSYNIIERGEVKVPKGKRLSAVSWEAVFPGEGRTEASFVKSQHWQEPNEIIGRIQRWKDAGNKLHLLITQTSVNMDVYIDSFDYSFEGGAGDAKYSISFIAAEDLHIKTVKEADAEKAAQQKSGIPELSTRASLPPETSSVSTAGQTLWSVAEQKLGDGARWAEIYAMNRDKVADADALKAGTKLKLPA